MARGSNGAVLAKANRDKARGHADSIRLVLMQLMVSGSPRPANLAVKLNEAGVPAAKGGKWYASTVTRALDRLGPHFREEVKEHRAKARAAFMTKSRS